MRKIWVFLTIVVLMAAGGLAWQSGGKGIQFEKSPGFAVVELFTSEGCSSCPPADDVLNDIVREADRSGAAVYALAFHVDYWNGLGWPDPFSTRYSTDRQNEYSRKFDSDRVYTPQMIVNGRSEFVGSYRGKARSEIATALAKQKSLPLGLDVQVREGQVFAALKATEAAGKTANVALVQRGLVTEVSRGENSGRTLHHENVVRDFKSVTVNANGMAEVSLSIPDGAKEDDLRVIAYVQEPETWQVIAATESKVPVPE